MTTSPLVTAQWLADHLDDPSLRILEVCALADEAVYRKGHIPGAQWVNWKDACWHETDRELVSPEAMAARLGGMGIGPNHTLVLYGDPVQHGSYTLWAFTMAGHKNLKLLDGSRKAWVKAGGPMTDVVPRFDPVAYPPPVPTRAMRVGRDDVRAKLGDARRLLLDVRAPEEYDGRRVIDFSNSFDHGAERKGRIPGARHLYFRDLLNDDDTLKPAEEIRRRLAAVAPGADKVDDLVVYCRLSHRATLAWVALAHVAGLANVKVYDGSWTEWGSIVGFPIER